MKAFILAAGKGNRLGSLTKTVPKPMLELAGKPILEHNILMCKNAGVQDIFINLHYLPNKITDYFGDGAKLGVKIKYNYEPDLLGTAGGILFFLDKLEESPFYVIYGDNYTEFDLNELKDYHELVNSDFTIALHWVDDVRNSGVVDLFDDGRISKFVEKPHMDFLNSGWVNSGIYIINPKIIIDLIKKDSDFSYDIIPKLINRNHKIYGYKLKNDIWAIDTPELFSNSNKELNINQ